jgi:hypothetical protein
MKIMENVIKKITLEIGGKEIDLTPDEVKQLHAALSELMDKPAEVRWYPYTPWYQQPNWYQPNWLYADTSGNKFYGTYTMPNTNEITVY